MKIHLKESIVRLRRGRGKYRKEAIESEEL
jgi:hypothetical protein